MKKLIERNVIYVSKELSHLNANQNKFFPFLKSSIINKTAHQEIIVKGIHAMANWGNIKDVVPHSKNLQEFVFFGRSNVGKSSLINKLVKKNFVQTSKKPGKTKELAFLKVKFPFETLLVDAPGYGYASDASKKEILNWGRLIEYYLKNTPNTDQQLILLLVDVMHGLKQTDGMLLKMLQSYSKQFMLVYTKSDRANQRQIQQSIEVAKKMQAKFKNMFYYVHYTSSNTQQGISELRNHILYRMGAKALLETPDKIEKV